MSSVEPNLAHADSAPPAQRRRRKRLTTRRVRWIVRAIVAVPLVGMLLLAILMRSPLVGSQVRALIKEGTGADLHASSIYIGIDGRLVLERPSLRVPFLDSEAAEVMSARRAVIDLDWANWRSLGLRPTSLFLEKPVFRVSQSLDDQSINLAGLTPPRASLPGSTGEATVPAPGTARPPQVSILDGRIEFADHSIKHGTFQVHHAIQVAGSLLPIDPASGIYSLKLQEIGRAPPVSPGPRGMILEGRLDLAHEDYSLRLLNLPLDTLPPDAVPRAYRETWRRLNVQGRVSESNMRYTSPGGLRVDLSLQGVSLDVPLQPYHQPEADSAALRDSLGISAVSGTISFSKGGLSADLNGLLEGQTSPSRVRLDTSGLSFDSALRCEIIGRRLSVDKNPSFFPYVPDKVREYFLYFSGPTAVFDARVVIVRDEPLAPGTPAPIRIADGRMVFHNGAAAFHKFPYPFHDMAGTVEFNESSIRFTNLSGRGPTGATMTGSASVEPLTDEAEVHVEVSTRHTPLDRFLFGAMPADDQRVIRTIFNSDAYDDLVRRDLIIPSSDRAKLERDLDDLRDLYSDALGNPAADPARVALVAQALREQEPRLAIPVFDLAGDADIRVKVFSAHGRDAPWTVDVDVAFPTAGILPEPFPYPLLAKDFRLKVTPDSAELIGGEFAGVRDGRATLTARVALKADGVRCVRPDIQIQAAGIPVDDLLLQAIPESAPDQPGATPEGFVGPPVPQLSAQTICRTLNVTGTIDATASITAIPGAASGVGSAFVSDLSPTEPTTPADPITYDVQVLLDRLRADPVLSELGPRVALENLRGALGVTPERLHIDHLTADLTTSAGAGEPADAKGDPAGAKLDVSLTVGLGGAGGSVGGNTDQSIQPGTIKAAVQAKDVDLGAPIEQFVALFNSDAGSFLTNLRAELSPRGLIDMGVRVEHTPPPPGPTGGVAPWGATDLREITFTNIRSVDVSVLSGRLQFACPSGAVVLTDRPTQDARPGALAFDFRELRADINYNHEHAASVEADGVFTLSQPDLRLVAPAGVRARIREGKVESSLVRALVGQALSPASADRFRALDLQGTFDLVVGVAPIVGNQDQIAAVRGLFTPRTLTFFDGTDRVELPPVAGYADFEASQSAPRGAWLAGGRFHGIELQAPDLSALLDGAWTYSVPAGFRLDAEIAAKAESLTERHKRLMPASVASVLQSLGVRIDGPWSLSPAHLAMNSGLEAAGSLNFDASLNFSGGSLDLGVPVTEADGRVRISTRTSNADQSQSFDVRIDRADMRMAGAQLTDVGALITSAAGSNLVEIAYATASCHAGRVWTSGRVLNDPGLSEAKPTYKADVMLAGVAFAPLLDELSESTTPLGRVAKATAASASAHANGATSDAADVPISAARNAAATVDQSRGLVDAWLSLSGTAGEPRSRVGRGSVRVASGRVLSLPIVLQLVQLSNFAVPDGDPLDYLQADLHIEGTTARFERIALLSDSIALLGTGTMQFPGLDLDMTFNSRGTARLPLLSDIFEVLRNEIATTRITGTIDEPDVQSQPLVGTRRAIGMIFNPDAEHMAPMTQESYMAVRRERERFKALLRPEAPVALPSSSVPPLPVSDLGAAAQVPAAP